MDVPASAQWTEGVKKFVEGLMRVRLSPLHNAVRIASY